MRHVMHKWIQVGCFRPAGQLIFSLVAVALVQCSCAAVPPPPETAEDLGCVKADDFCRHLPTVGRCKRVAARIHNDCLRKCVIEQCTKAMVRCDEFIEQVCRERDKARPGGGHAAGFSEIGTCTQPRPSIFWCSRSFKDPLRARTCQEEGLVHEFAHSCGFRHDSEPLRAGEMHDHGVPGHDGVLYDCET